MRYLLLVLFLVGCGDDKKENVIHIEPETNFTQVQDVEFIPKGLPFDKRYNGDVEVVGVNSWVLTSNTNDTCIYDNNKHHWCKKVDILTYDFYKEDLARFSFRLNVVEHPDISPYYLILFQDWRRQNELDSMGRHPITNVKLKKDDNGLYITHCDNSWQWGYDFGDDPTDLLHELHQENDCHGKYRVQIGIDYDIDFYLSKLGASLVINNKVVSDELYKTKSEHEDHRFKFGMYWSPDHNQENDPLKRIILSVSDFTISVADR